MIIISDQGEIVEGQELNIEEVEIYNQLCGKTHKSIYVICKNYIFPGDVKNIAMFLFENFKLTRRLPDVLNTSVSTDETTEP